VAPGGANGRSVVAYHKLTGERIWGSLNEEAAYSSPMRVTLAGQPQLLVAVLDRVVGLRIEDGSVLWEFPWTVQMNNRNIAQPVILGTNRFLMSAGYGTGCVAVEVTRSENAFAAREVWRNKNLKNKFSSSVFWQGHIYGLDEDMLVCIDAATGARRWKAGRYEYGQVLLAGGQLIVLCGNGDLAIVLATPEKHDELIRFPAIEGKTWNHPAIGEGYLLVRNALEMTCFDIAAGR
jgi:outer membrane protein assembly factor BamB